MKIFILTVTKPASNYEHIVRGKIQQAVDYCKMLTPYSIVVDELKNKKDETVLRFSFEISDDLSVQVQTEWQILARAFFAGTQWPKDHWD